MSIHIARNGNALGEFEEDKIADAIKLGVLKPTDHYYADGMEEWKTLEDFLTNKKPGISANPLRVEEPNYSLKNKSKPFYKYGVFIAIILLIIGAFIAFKWGGSSQTEENNTATQPYLLDDSNVSAIRKKAAPWSQLRTDSGIVINDNVNYSGWAFKAYKNDQLNCLAKFEDGLLKRLKTWSWDGSEQFDIGFIGMTLPGEALEIITEGERGPFRMGLIMDYQVGEEYSHSGFHLGLFEDPYLVWHENGKIGVDFKHKNGKPDGECAIYSDDGNPYIKITYQAGKPVKYSKWRSREVKEFENNFRNGKKHGLQSDWYENGNKALEIHYEDGLVMFAKGWKPNGERGRTSVVDGSGLITLYDENDESYSEELYENGKLNGDTVFYYQVLKPRLRVTYKDGEIIGRKSYDKEGNLIEEK